MIERHKRLSSLYGNEFRSEVMLPSSPVALLSSSPPKKGLLCPDNSRTHTPEKAFVMRRSSSANSRLSVSPARSATSSQTRSRENSFFGSGDTPDLLSILRRRSDQEASPQEGEEGISTYLASPSSAIRVKIEPESPKSTLGYSANLQHPRRPTLASELHNDWSASEATSAYLDTDSQTHAASVSSASLRDRRQGLVLYDGVKSVKALSDMGANSSTSTRSAHLEDDDLNDYRELLSPGAPDAEAYDGLTAALQDLPVTWADDRALSNTSIRAIERKHASKGPQTSFGGMTWTYDDGDEDSGDNDPWKEDIQPTQAIESRESVAKREKADQNAHRRRLRLQELARQILEDEEDLGDSFSRADLSQVDQTTLKQVTYKAYCDEDDLSSQGHNGSRRGSGSSTSSDFEQVVTNKRPNGRGTDYWPVSYGARYTPQVVAMRVQKTSQEYINMCIMWTKFLAVLGVAVIFSLWRGPKSSLGLERQRRRRLQPSIAEENGGSRSRALSMRGRKGR